MFKDKGHFKGVNHVQDIWKEERRYESKYRRHRDRPYRNA